MTEESPFSPGKTVSTELFVGRKDKINEIVQYIEDAASGNQKTVFLSGNRGYGKTSLANFLRTFAEKKANMLGLHIRLGGVSTTDELVNRIFESIINESNGQIWFNEIIELCGPFVNDVSLFGISYSFNPPENQLKALKNNFSAALSSVINVIGTEKAGIFIALDDLDDLAYNSNFANWYKSFVEPASIGNDFPIFIMLIGLPEDRDALLSSQESLNRIFEIIEMNILSNEEVEEFYKKAFESVGIKIEDEALDFMLLFGGHPVIMHEIGDAIFFKARENLINKRTAISGVNKAAKRLLEKKYIKKDLLDIIIEEKYETLLRKIVNYISFNFNEAAVSNELSSDEKLLFKEFIEKLSNSKLIEITEIDNYNFVNTRSLIYMKMKFHGHEI